jgi:ABC-type glycerol-3-phosphate transport system substrate-binding protein
LLLNVQKYAADLSESVAVTLLGQKQKASLWYANTFFLSKKEHVNEAWSLLASLVFDDDNFRQYHEAQGGLPPRKSVTDTAAHITPLHHVLIDDVMNAPGSHTTPAVPFNLEVLERISEMCQKAVFGQATPEEAVTTAADEANQIIQRYRGSA